MRKQTFVPGLFIVSIRKAVNKEIASNLQAEMFAKRFFFLLFILLAMVIDFPSPSMSACIYIIIEIL